MRFWLLALLFSVSTLYPTQAWAEEGAEEAQNEQFPVGLVYGVHVGANIASGFLGSTSGWIGFQAGADAKYYFAPNIGLASGLQFTTRGNNTQGAWFLDVPVALSFRYGGLMAKDSGFSYMDLGAFGSIPFGDISPTLPTKFGLGIYVGGGTLFKVSDSFRMGFASWFKFGLSPSLNIATNNRLLEVGIGIVSLF